MKIYIAPEFEDIELDNAAIMNSQIVDSNPLEDQILSGYGGEVTEEDVDD